MKKERRAARKTSEPAQAADPSDPLGIDKWRETLEQFSRATGLTLALVDAAGALRVGPLTASPLGETLVATGTWQEPDGVCLASARNAAQRCIAESAIALATTADLLSVLAVPIRDRERPIAAITAGWVFTNFPEPVSTDRLARILGLSFPDIWQIVRQVAPMSSEKLALYGNLLQVLADLFMRHRVETDEKFALIDDLQRQQAELERAARARDELFAVVSHELRTPLTPVLGWIPIIREEIELGRLDQAREGLDAVERNARQEVHLIDEMLDLSRILTGRIVFSPSHVVAAEVVSHAASAARSVIGTRPLAIQTDLEERLPSIWADRQRLLQVLANLVSNAIKFTPAGGLVTIGARAEKDVVELFVSDTGIGVNPEAVPFIFERFQQADGGIQRRYGGLGIGLSVVRNLVEMQGGRVRVESPGRNGGATFIVSLPASATPAVLPAPPAVPGRPTPDEMQAAKERRRSFRLLVVDDVQDTLHLMERVLARAGFEVATAASATAAMASARSDSPDALVSDLSMPDCDGLELLRQLRTEAGLTNLPAVAVSGFTGESERAAAIQSGFNAYFTKPLDVPQLLETLDRFLLAAPPHKARRKSRCNRAAKS